MKNWFKNFRERSRYYKTFRKENSLYDFLTSHEGDVYEAKFWAKKANKRFKEYGYDIK